MSYILGKNDLPPWTIKSEIPSEIPRVPHCFTNANQPAPWTLSRGSSRAEDRLSLAELDDKWQSMFDAESQQTSSALIMSRARRTIMTLLRQNPFVPFSLRATVFAFSVAGLGLAAKIFVLTENLGHGGHQQPSVIMALVVLSVAIVYLVYSIYNEFFGQPLGLRSVRSNMTFVLLDMIFIIFASSNLSLAFNTLYDRSWLCHRGELSLCTRQRDLVGVLFVSLCFWLMTFTVSLFRMMDKAVG